MKRAPLFFTAAAVLAVIAIHIFLGAQSIEFASPLALFDRVFDVGLAACIVLAAVGWGRIVLRQLFGFERNVLEEIVFAFGIGTGLLGMLLLFIGFAGLLYAPVVLGVLVGVVIATQTEWRALIFEARRHWSKHDRLSLGERLFLFALALVVLPVFLSALTPPTDADALGYHLAAPALFLSRHAVVASFDNVGANYPINVDLLYLFGLAAGSDVAAQLVHFTIALVVSVGILAFATRYFNRRIGLIGMVAFWLSPVVGLEASAPIIDLGQTLYEFLAVYAFFIWRGCREPRRMVLTGAMLGFALSSKYLAVVGLGLLVLLIMADNFRSTSLRICGKNVVIMVGVAVVIASPWYLKNWIWLGNPVYPFFLGNYGMDGNIRPPAGALGGLSAWMGMGLGHDLNALLWFPWNVYVHWQFFGAPTNRGGPTFLFLFLPLYLLLPKRSIVQWLLLICAIRFAAWWVYIQNVRYLIVVFPWLGLITAYVISGLADRWRPSLRFGLALMVGFSCLIGVALQWGFLFALRENAVPFLVGAISRDQYLDENLLSYPATRFMNTRLPADARILAIGDWRVYYIRREVIMDDGHTNWVDLLTLTGDANSVAARMRAMRVSHIWISEDEMTYARNVWGREGISGSNARIFEEFSQRFLDPVYADERGHAIFALRGAAQP